MDIQDTMKKSFYEDLKTNGVPVVTSRWHCGLAEQCSEVKVTVSKLLNCSICNPNRFSAQKMVEKGRLLKVK